MDILENYRYLARYNRWFNERLYDACEALPEQERRKDRGGFFGSVQETLSHILWADLVWLARFATFKKFEALKGLEGLGEGTSTGSGGTGEGLARTVAVDWAELRRRRRLVDAAIEEWIAAMPADFPSSMMRYKNLTGHERNHEAWIAITHLFNHQTHHRGQATTLLFQAGIDPGVTDLLAMPEK